jgi:microcystin-dependent protein
MILNSTASVTNGHTLVSRVGGDSWLQVMLPAFMRATAYPRMFMIAEVDTTAGDWLQLSQPYYNPTQASCPVQIAMDYTPELNLPIANIGDVNIADLYNRALFVLDRAPTNVALHGPTHVGLGLDPVPLASTTDSGMLGRLSGKSTDYVGGDNICHATAGVPTGTIASFAGATLPTAWLWCDNQLYSRSVYGALYALIRDMYGPNDGATNFRTPDLRGRFIIGAMGAGPGLQNRAFTEKSGEEYHQLTWNEMPVHAHGVGQNPHQHQYVNPITDLNAQPGSGMYSASGGALTDKRYADVTIGNAGASWSHNNVPPYLALNVIIKT